MSADYGLGADEDVAELGREQVSNPSKSGIYRKEVVYKANPKRRFKYYWWTERKDELGLDELADLKGVHGYSFVDKENFESSRWEFDEQGYLRNGRQKLMFRDADGYEQERQTIIDRSRGQVISSNEEFHEQAARTGVGTTESFGDGREQKVVPPAKRLNFKN